METLTQTKWIVDPTHSEVHFKVKHLVISTVTGTFKVFSGEMSTGNDNFTDADIRFSLDVSSISTNQEQRDEHLKSAEFFDAAQYPKITFQSASFIKSGDDYELTGNLTIKEVSRPVKLHVEFGGSATDFYGNEKAGFEISGKINRKDYGLTWNGITEAGAIVVAEDIKLSINLQFAKQV
ncbi:MAG: YceI family protein [Flavobacterium sp.]|nr:YceI family protein [Pedobacter sp.]